MHDRGNFKEHKKERFLKPIPGQPSDSRRGEYFTPKIQDFHVVDFRKAGFRARDKDEFRLVIVFDASFAGCEVWRLGLKVRQISFQWGFFMRIAGFLASSR